MKRALIVTGVLAMGLLVAGTRVSAQDEPAKTSGGKIVIGALGVEDVSSSKFQEYREVPKGISIPYANLFAAKGTFDFNLEAFKVRQSDQRYTGWLTAGWFGVSFDYNQIPHNRGNDASVIHAETAPGVWSMSSTLRQVLGASADAMLPSTARNHAFYTTLLSPTLAAASTLDLSSLRKRGTAAFDFGRDLPFDLTFTYMRELKSGSRTAGGGDILGAVSPVIDLPEPLDDVVQDFGVRFGYNFKAGHVYASYNRNLYDNQAETLIFDNPFQAADTPYTASVGAVPAYGGPGRALVINAPDNEASTTRGGFLLKFARQTRIGGDLAFATWTQNAAFYPYTINSVVFTTTGAPANALSTLQQPSLNGKINTTTLNFNFSSRPIRGLGLRASYRSYDLSNETTRWIITGDMSGSPDRSWSAVTASPDAPYGHATANPYDTKTARFNASVSYDIGDLTLEGAFHNTQIERTHREAEKGEDSGYLFAAVYRSNEWLNFRAKYEDTSRTAEGHTVYGFQADEADRDTTRTGLEVEIMPVSSVGLTFAYQRRDVDFPNRPDRVAVASGVPVPGQGPYPGTPSGLLEAKYDSYTVEFDYTPSERAEFNAYYTYEKDASTVQWSSTNSAPVYGINNLLNYSGSDKTDTFGVNARFQLVPDKWTCSFNVMRQKVDGLMDITAREAGSFYTPGRTTLIPAGQGGAADIADWDDTELTTVMAQLDYAVAKAWKLGVGYWYEKYDFKDAFTDGTGLMPQAVLIFMKPNDGPYTANVVYAKLSYSF